MARVLKLQSEVLQAKTPGEIRTAVDTLARRRSAAAIVLADPLFVLEAGTIVRMAADQRLPVMYGLREAVVAGGLMAYGASFPELFRRAATYVDISKHVGRVNRESIVVDEIVMWSSGHLGE